MVYAERVPRDQINIIQFDVDRSGNTLRLIQKSLEDHGQVFAELDHLPFPSPDERLRSIAIGRLFLDNIPHIKAYWVMLGIPVAQTSLAWGANDLDGTVSQERIYHDAGAGTPEVLSRERLLHLICEAGRVPVERDTLYKPIEA